MRVAWVTADLLFVDAVGRARAAAGPSSDDPLEDVLVWKDEYLRIDPSKVADDIAASGARIACLGPFLPAEQLIDIAGAIDRDLPDMAVVLLAEPSAALLRQAVRAGVRDVVAPDGPVAETVAAIGRAAHAAGRRIPPENVPGVEQPHRTIAVVSPKGGAGKTALASNLAVLLARRGGSVAIADLDLQFGDVAAALHLKPEHTLADLVQATEPVDATMAKVFLTPHRSGLHVMCAPEAPAEADSISHGDITQVLGFMAAEFAFVVVDTPAGLGPETLTALEQASDVVLLCTTDVASVRSLRKELDALDSLGMTTARRHLVLNRADAQVAVAAGDVEKVLGADIAVQVPSSRLVPLSMNRGVPLVDSDPRSPVARAIADLAGQIAGRPAGAATSRPAQPGHRRRWRR